MALEYSKPIRTDEATFIEIDAKKGQWPYMRAEVFNGKLILGVDSNTSPTVTDGHLIAAVALSQKKQRALRDFLCSLDLGDDEIE